MRGVDPKDIPVGGERYDMLVTKAGLNDDGEPFAHLTIETGQFKGKRISGPVPSGVRAGHRLSALLHVAYYSRITQEPVEGHFRDDNVVVRYSLTDHARRMDGRPSNPLPDPRSRFRR